MTKVVATKMERSRSIQYVLDFERKKSRDLLIYAGSDKKREIQDDF